MITFLLFLPYIITSSSYNSLFPYNNLLLLLTALSTKVNTESQNAFHIKLISPLGYSSKNCDCIIAKGFFYLGGGFDIISTLHKAKLKKIYQRFTKISLNFEEKALACECHGNIPGETTILLNFWMNKPFPFPSPLLIPQSTRPALPPPPLTKLLPLLMNSPLIFSLAPSTVMSHRSTYSRRSDSLFQRWGIPPPLPVIVSVIFSFPCSCFCLPYLSCSSTFSQLPSSKLSRFFKSISTAEDSKRGLSTTIHQLRVDHASLSQDHMLFRIWHYAVLKQVSSRTSKEIPLQKIFPLFNIKGDPPPKKSNLSKLTQRSLGYLVSVSEIVVVVVVVIRLEIIIYVYFTYSTPLGCFNSFLKSAIYHRTQRALLYLKGKFVHFGFVFGLENFWHFQGSSINHVFF
ncbi:putative signal peptide protein [Puccinia sorghi]|uniref:Putative signal peptide protein n=1 Tax=Puccinia sorghi TaxID=27349 RepID=A0A0L6V4Z7_9BASI|nr:putative signal peptide protein [Puccinia sorghi]